MHIYIHTHSFAYVNTCTHTHIYIYNHIHIHRKHIIQKVYTYNEQLHGLAGRRFDGMLRGAFRGHAVGEGHLRSGIEIYEK